MNSPKTTQPDIKIIVHWLEGSRATRVLVLLEELKILYTIKTYKRHPSGIAPEELKKVHPLGKSPAVEIQIPNQEPFVLAESGAIFEYFCENFGKSLIPARVSPGMEGQVGVESEEFRRNRYFMHYAEGSLMSLLAIAAVMLSIKNGPFPFFVKPIVRIITGKLDEAFLDPNLKTHLEFLEDQLRTSPSDGPYLCGRNVTEADFLVIFPIQACKQWASLTPTKFPRVCAYLELMESRDSYKEAERRIIEIEGSFKPVF